MAAEIARLGSWFHNLHLPDGSQTAPGSPFGDFPANKWALVGAALPADLSGWRCLYIGCNAGFYSFELARREASVRHRRRYALSRSGALGRRGQWAGRADRVSPDAGV